ncbi:hypothetical protein QJS10_CPA08g00634 [Acorus calamus]|uniref:Uncharacterized protein n=1 Tax=Acorus calamus TaxID=4465 RepID=A0AAV9ECG4_ACOCL|nr:hypothetical protein QJS10_CPA08g00634 [Acorus calamus]
MVVCALFLLQCCWSGQFHRDLPTTVFVYGTSLANATFPSPTIVAKQGTPLQSDSSALTWFTANFSETGPKWTKATYTYPNILHAANLWYY